MLALHNLSVKSNGFAFHYHGVSLTDIRDGNEGF